MNKKQNKYQVTLKCLFKTEDGGTESYLQDYFEADSLVDAYMTAQGIIKELKENTGFSYIVSNLTHEEEY